MKGMEWPERSLIGWLKSQGYCMLKYCDFGSSGIKINLKSVGNVGYSR
jgi:hypothetical protein